MPEESTKERIVILARQRFLAEGFSRISIDDLTSALSMSKKTFYQVFESKEDLITQIMERMMGEIRRDVELIIQSEEDFVHKLHDLMAVMGSRLSSVGKPFQQDIQRHMPDLWKRIEEFRRKRIIENFSKLLRQGGEEGFIRPDVNLDLFLLVYMAAIEYIVRPSVLANQSFSAGEALQGIMRIFFKGILTDGARAELERLQLDKSLTT